MRIFKKKLKNDQSTWSNPPNIIPMLIFPVAPSVEKVIEATERTPRAKIGEKSTIPIRVNEKRLNQFKYGSQRPAIKRPGVVYSSWGIQDIRILKRHIKEYTDTRDESE